MWGILAVLGVTVALMSMLSIALMPDHVTLGLLTLTLGLILAMVGLGLDSRQR